MELAIYIKNLLYNNDRVIISGLGTLYTVYRSAEINSTQHTIAPPSKTLAFDGSITNSDGNLEKFIASQKGTTKRNAEKLVAKHIEEVNKKLDAGETLFWEGIGYFSKENGIVRFEPEPGSNFLTDSFGLSNIDYKPVEFKLTPKPSEVIYKQKNYTFLIVASILIVIIGVGVALYLYNPTLLNSFKTKKTTVAQQASPKDSLIASSKDTSKVSELEQVVDKATDKKNALAPNKVAITQSEKALFYIIAGSFKTYDRATILAKQLKKEGYNPEVMQFDRDLYRVSLGEFNDKPKALQQLDKIKATKGSDAVWLLTKKM